MTEPRSAPAARAADVASPEAVVRAVYEIISGRASDPRDWERLRTLYAPDARLLPTLEGPDGTTRVDAFDVDGYVRSRRALLADLDFFERETSSRVDRWGAVAHVLSGYEIRRTPDGPVVGRGQNSVQLVHDRGRWWILSVLWSADPAVARTAPTER